MAKKPNHIECSFCSGEGFISTRDETGQTATRCEVCDGIGTLPADLPLDDARMIVRAEKLGLIGFQAKLDQHIRTLTRETTARIDQVHDLVIVGGLNHPRLPLAVRDAQAALQTLAEAIL